MSSFYNVLINTKVEPFIGVLEAFITDEQKEAFKQYGDFLDAIPLKQQTRVASEIMDFILQYNHKYNLYNHSYQGFDKEKQEFEQKIKSAKLPKEIEQKLLKKYKPGRDNSKKFTSDLKTAKRFRDTLESFDQFTETLSSEQVAYLERVNEREEPYWKMVALVDAYIQDLESKRYDIANKANYENMPKRPNKKN
ncbi:MAG TPA: hypothetical protein EYG70_02955 [Sulfurimonas sp.]|nr:hypothetical protein [Sulfurimonas sp.]